MNLELGGNYKLTFTAPLTEGAKIGLCNNYTGIFTEDGCEDLSAAFPVTVEEIEAIMAK